MLSKEYFEKITELLNVIKEKEIDNINQAAEMITQAIVNGNKLFAFGCGHSSLPVQDVYYRAGGLMLVNPIFGPGFTFEMFPPTFTSQLERLEGYGNLILDRVPISEGDVLIIISISGRNAVPLDMANYAKSKGVKVIGITSLEYSKGAASRHSSGKMLYEVVDLVINNPIPTGDGILELEGVPQKFCPASGVASSAIMQAIMAATIEKLVERGFTPPIYISGNVEGGDEHNRKMLAQYKDRIIYL